jgi:hypothetical protein
MALAEALKDIAEVKKESGRLLYRQYHLGLAIKALKEMILAK